MTLVLVLGLVALCTILVVAFLTLMSAQLVTSKAASNETTATQLATTAVQLVEGTIIHATEPRTSAGVPDTGQAWACQPGMIRTYGTAVSGSQTTPNGTPLAYYKLYSATNMIVSAPISAYNVDSDIVGAWDQAPALFTDLNAPLNAGTTNEVFPIVDPRAADSDIAVQGFSYSSTNTMSPTTVNGVTNSTSVSTSDTISRLPMPVRWLYVLQDGTLTAPGGTTTATWTSGTPTSTTGEYPTATNAIVGRVAFWTDDECGKLNINTASEGTFADTPIANSTNSAPASGSLGGAFGATNSWCGELQLSMLPGGAKEYQRYPGHPATTCLSTVLGNYLGGSSLSHWLMAQAITDAIPRVSEYGTAGGSTPVSSQAGTFSLVASGLATTNVAPDMDRLYSSVDEFGFKANSAVAISRTGQTFSNTSSISTLPIAQTCRFFLTANSKAPELNLFGLPRIAMWPVWDDNYAGSRTILDNEILRCATVATNAASGYVHPMIFSREDSTSPTNDWSSTTTLAGQPRNQQLYGYLQTLTSRAVPGYGGTFNNSVSKYSTADRDQILTEIFDYIRCTNIQDNSTNSITGTHAFSYTGSFVPGTLNGQANSGQSPVAPGNSPGQVVPIQIASPTVTQGFGRVAMVSELALAFFKVDDRNSTTAQGDSGTKLSLTNTILGSDPNTLETPALPAKYTPGVAASPQTLVEWALIPMLASPSAGWGGIANNIRIKFSSINLTITDTGYSSASAGTRLGYTANINNTNSGFVGLPDVFATGKMSNDRDAVIGGLMGAEALIDNTTTLSMVPTGLYLANSPSTQTGYTGPGNLTFYGTVTVQVFAPSTATTPIQTINFVFPSTGSRGAFVGSSAPIPDLDYNSTNSGVNQWYGTYRATSSNYNAGTNSSTTNIFTYPTIYNNGNAVAGATTAIKNSSSRIGGSSYHWLGGYVSGDPTAPATGSSGSDVIRALDAGGTMGGPGNTNNYQGDLRMLATTNNVPPSAFTLAPAIGAGSPYTPSAPSKTTYAADSLRLGLLFSAPGCRNGNLITNSSSYTCLVPSASYNGGTYSIINGVTMAGPGDGNNPGDWDNGQGLMVDGPYINKPDEGVNSGVGGTAAGGGMPYIGYYQAVQSSGAQLSSLFAPNRIVSSPVMFGSLTVGPDHPWRTLLFRPATLPGYGPNGSGTYTHPGGSATIPDHLLLDLFWMPVVEPYGISEPLATAGKINLNYQIAPFTYITRSTGMQAVLKSVMITGLSPNQSGMGLGANYIGNYKSCVDYGGSYNQSFAKNNITRYAIDPNLTLAQFDSRFIAGGVTSPSNPNFFVSASDICDVPLFPALPSGLGGPLTAASLATFWQKNGLTGDNELERPYTYIYPRVTTQSNVFTVHVRAQSLKQVPADLNTGKWVEGTDLVTGEYRGSFVIEKYLDPDNANITDSSGSGSYTTNSAASDASITSTSCMRGATWRILSNKRFSQ